MIKSTIINPIIATKSGKEVRILASYGSKNFEVAQVTFASDGSLYFNLTGSPIKDIKCGKAYVSSAGNNFEKNPPDKMLKCDSGFHFSLHPHDNCIHIRENKKGSIVEKVVNNWFPVTSPRNILQFWTAPLTNLLESKKQTYFSLPVPKEHVGSIYGKIDLYPTGTKEFILPTNSFSQIFGQSPQYLVCLSFILHSSVDPHLMYPEKADKL